METTTVRISLKTRDSLKKLAAEMGEPMTVVLDRAVYEYWAEQWLHEMNEGYARLRADPVAWQEEMDERALFEGTLMDGLEDDPWIEESAEQTSGSPISNPSEGASKEAHVPA